MDNETQQSGLDGDFEIEEMKVEREIKPEDLEREKQLANAVAEE